MISVLQKWGSFVRFSHTVFALPFALAAMLVAARDHRGWPGWQTFGLILAAMVSARTCAMSFNRIVDRKFDALNPRTKNRHLPAGQISLGSAVSLCLLSGAGLIVASYFLNPLCFYLSPFALVLVCFYSLTKRFTDYTHVYLGIALALAPVGAWLAVTGSFAAPPLILAAGVLSWVAGFDIIYATQDLEADQREGLRSLVVWLGVSKGLALARLLHFILLIALLFFGVSAHLGSLYFFGLIPIPFLLFYEHRIASTLDLGKINKAFFETNAVVGLLFVVIVTLDRVF